MSEKKKQGHGAFSRWLQQRMNARMNRKIRSGRGRFMGMDVLILNTVGRRTGKPRETPVAWFPDGAGNWLVIASGGGGNRFPDWHLNLMGQPHRATVELPGREEIPVTPQILEGADRALAWERITAIHPRYEKYQRKSGHDYPIVRLMLRGSGH